MSALRAALAAVLSGVLLVFSVPRFGTGAVAWVALVPLLVAVEARGGRGATWLAYLAGVIGSLGMLYWTALVVVQYGGLSRPLAATAMVALCLVYASFHAGFGWILGTAVRLWGTLGLLVAPVAWVAMEALRGHVLFRFPWFLLGYSQSQNLPILQLVSLGGVLAVSFLIVLVAAALALVVRHARDRSVWGALVVVVMAWVAAFAWGATRLAQPVATTGTLRVGIVQAAIPQDEKWDPSSAWRNVEAHLRLSREAARQGARLVVWPESAVPYDLDWTPQTAADLRALARQDDVFLLFGNDDRDATGRVFVGAKLMDPGGHVTLRYHKMRLVPFGEYVPLEGVLGALGVKKLVQEVGSFAPGSKLVLGEVDGVRLGVSICYEATFSDLARSAAREGAQVLVNITNDAWYGWTSAPYQHFAMARVRAVETGRFYVRCANTGISSVIDPRGRLLGRTRLFQPTTLVENVGVCTEATPYVRLGDILGPLCLVAGALLLIWAAGRRWRSRRLRRSSADPLQ